MAMTRRWQSFAAVSFLAFAMVVLQSFIMLPTQHLRRSEVLNGSPLRGIGDVSDESSLLLGFVAPPLRQLYRPPAEDPVIINIPGRVPIHVPLFGGYCAPRKSLPVCIHRHVCYYQSISPLFVGIGKATVRNGSRYLWDPVLDVRQGRPKKGEDPAGKDVDYVVGHIDFEYAVRQNSFFSVMPRADPATLPPISFSGFGKNKNATALDQYSTRRMSRDYALTYVSLDRLASNDVASLSLAAVEAALRRVPRPCCNASLPSFAKLTSSISPLGFAKHPPAASIARSGAITSDGSAGRLPSSLPPSEDPFGSRHQPRTRLSTPGESIVGVRWFGDAYLVSRTSHGPHMLEEMLPLLSLSVAGIANPKVIILDIPLELFQNTSAWRGGVISSTLAAYRAVSGIEPQILTRTDLHAMRSRGIAACFSSVIVPVVDIDEKFEDKHTGRKPCAPLSPNSAAIPALQAAARALSDKSKFTDLHAPAQSTTAFSDAPVNPPYRVLLIHRKENRKLHNMKAVASMLRGHATELLIVDLAALSFIAQVRLFQKADLVVAAHGAGLANAVFMRSGATVIEIYFQSYYYSCYYSPFVQAAGASYVRLCKGPGGGCVGEPFVFLWVGLYPPFGGSVNITTLESVVERAKHAYQTGVALAPFEPPPVPVLPPQDLVKHGWLY